MVLYYCKKCDDKGTEFFFHLAGNACTARNDKFFPHRELAKIQPATGVSVFEFVVSRL